jgi:hypothetical protein
MLVVNFADRADVGMIERGGGLGFRVENAEGLRVLGEFFGKKLRATWRPLLRPSAS